MRGRYESHCGFENSVIRRQESTRVMDVTTVLHM